ncbi:aspartate-semialdehyde dehydrogenase [Enterobacteriaceae bacterium LUAb1]
MSVGWNIALLGATGATGNALLATLAARAFPAGEVWLLGSERSAGEVLRFNGKSLRVENARDFDWSQAQLAFFAAGSQAAAQYAEEAAGAGCLVIDSSDYFSLEPDVPLVVPDVNPQVLADYRNRNIISVADSLTSQLLCAVNPLTEVSGLSRLQVTALLPASASGRSAVEALAGESARLLNGMPADEYYFGRQLAFNLLPQLTDSLGSVMQERRLVDQVRKVMRDGGLPISVSVVQTPVFYGSAQIVHFEGQRPLSAEEARNVMARANALQLSDEDDYPTQVGDASDNDRLSIGALRNDYGLPELLQFWSVADNIRFGGALMAVKTAETLIQEYLYS